jgi:hypothetical protein
MLPIAPVGGHCGRHHLVSVLRFLCVLCGEPSYSGQNGNRATPPTAIDYGAPFTATSPTGHCPHAQPFLHRTSSLRATKSEFKAIRPLSTQSIGVRKCPLDARFVSAACPSIARPATIEKSRPRSSIEATWILPARSRRDWPRASDRGSIKRDFRQKRQPSLPLCRVAMPSSACAGQGLAAAFRPRSPFFSPDAILNTSAAACRPASPCSPR